MPSSLTALPKIKRRFFERIYTPMHTIASPLHFTSPQHHSYKPVPPNCAFPFSIPTTKLGLLPFHPPPPHHNHKPHHASQTQSHKLEPHRQNGRIVKPPPTSLSPIAQQNLIPPHKQLPSNLHRRPGIHILACS